MAPRPNAPDLVRSRKLFDFVCVFFCISIIYIKFFKITNVSNLQFFQMLRIINFNHLKYSKNSFFEISYFFKYIYQIVNFSKLSQLQKLVFRNFPSFNYFLTFTIYKIINFQMFTLSKLPFSKCLNSFEITNFSKSQMFKS